MTAPLKSRTIAVSRSPTITRVHRSAASAKTAFCPGVSPWTNRTSIWKGEVMAAISAARSPSATAVYVSKLA
ncbi:hypothetical protein [Streptomyces sp. NPDC093598]|uniref:hypothetical protein n=1 Tax=Streptomyces sp. NPDC093598 TaxID=3366046 RepID=UPI00381688E4